MTTGSFFCPAPSGVTFYASRTFTQASADSTELSAGRAADFDRSAAPRQLVDVRLIRRRKYAVTLAAKDNAEQHAGPDERSVANEDKPVAASGAVVESSGERLLRCLEFARIDGRPDATTVKLRIVLADLRRFTLEHHALCRALLRGADRQVVHASSDQQQGKATHPAMLSQVGAA